MKKQTRAPLKAIQKSDSDNSVHNMHPELVAGRCPGKPAIHPIPLDLQSQAETSGIAVLLSPTKALADGSLEFIQETVSMHLSSGKSIKTLSDELSQLGWHINENGELLDPVHLVRKGEKIIAVDNRRFMGSLADTPDESQVQPRVYAIIHNPDSPLSARDRRRFSTSGFSARVWNDAIESRARGNKTRKTSSSALPRLRGATAEDLANFTDVQKGPGFYRTPSKSKCARGLRF